MKKDKTFYQVLCFNHFEDEGKEIIDDGTEYFEEMPTEAQVIEIMQRAGSKYAQCYFDGYETDEYDKFCFDVELD